MMFSRLSPLLCLVSSLSLVGCVATPSTESPASPVQVAESSSPPVTKPSVRAASVKVTQPLKTTPSQRQVQTPTAPRRPVAKSPVVTKAVRSTSVKTITGNGYKAGQKLSPAEVEAIIRQLSVCRPTKD